MTLTLTGSCTGIPPIKEVQNFSTQVRGRDVKMIAIPNRTNQYWDLTPVIEGEYWTGSVTFNVEPQQVKQYELVYKPLTMTSEHKKHQVRWRGVRFVGRAHASVQLRLFSVGGTLIM